jgi:predicted RNase H-like HicB family nuclease
VSATNYEVTIEEGDTWFGAYVPDLPGCVAVGESRDEAMGLIREAIQMHIESLRENGEFHIPPGTLSDSTALE